MKTNNKNRVRGFMLTLGLGAVTLSGFAQEHIKLSLQNITSTKNTIEYDLYVTNDGMTDIKLAACAFGVDYNGAIHAQNLAQGSYLMMPGSRAQALGSLTPATTAVVNRDHQNQLRMTTIPVRRNQAATLLKNVPYKVGRFKVTHQSNWATNSNPSFSLHEFNVPGLTTSCATGYVNNSQYPIAFSVAKKNLSVEVVESPVLNPTNGDITRAVSTAQLSAETAEGMLPEIARSNEGSASTWNEINMYPNPTQDVLHIDFTAEHSAQALVKVMDIRGRMVKQIQAKTDKGVNRLSISLSEVPAGVYNVQMFEDNVLNATRQITKKD